MEQQQEIEVVVAGLVLDPASDTPIILLKSVDEDFALPIWIGLPEATAIASAIKKVSFSRPMTHDLLMNTIEHLGGKIDRVVIHGLEENTFLANIEVELGGDKRAIDSRPSDALALAVRSGCRVFVEQGVFAAAKVQMVEIPGEDGVATEGGGEVDEGILTQDERWAVGEMLGDAGTDPDKWSEILADLDPDDFKYKM